MMKRFYFFFVFILLVFPAVAGFYHEPAHEPTEEKHDSTTSADESVQQDTVSYETGEKGLFAPFSAFPNLHPLVVHFPVVLLILAFFTQLFALFLQKKAFSFITLFLLLFGLVGAYMAAFVFHPHPEGLQGKAHEILETHESLAMWTFWGSLVAFILKLISHFLLKLKIWFEILVLAAVLVPALSVTLAGHLGSQMVFLESIGPQGEKVEGQSGAGEEPHEH